MMKLNINAYNNTNCLNEHLVERASESPRRETLRGRNAWPIPFPGLEHTKWGHNDLELRKARLCHILQKTCPSPIDVMDIVQEINHIPFPLGAH